MFIVEDVFSIIFYVSLIPAVFYIFKAIICKINKNNPMPYLKKLVVTFLITLFALIGYNIVV